MSTLTYQLPESPSDPASASQRGGPVKLSSTDTFHSTLKAAESQINSVIASKLESFFELAEYSWTPTRPQSTSTEPSTYVFEMITFLTAYVDSVLIGLNEGVKTRAYASALQSIQNWLMVSHPPAPWVRIQWPGS